MRAIDIYIKQNKSPTENSKLQLLFPEFTHVMQVHCRVIKNALFVKFFQIFVKFFQIIF